MGKAGPDFIGIGAMKAGTSWLYYRLSELSEFTLPVIKEFHYFDRSAEYHSRSVLREERLMNRLKDRRWVKDSFRSTNKYLMKGDINTINWMLKWYYSNYNDNWYLSLFKPFKGITGEITPAYAILDHKAVGKMYSLVPEAKIFFILRNPAERAWSQYRFMLRLIKNRKKTIDIKDFESFMNHPNQYLRSDYMRTIEIYKKYFYDNQIIICFFDAIKEQPQVLLENVVSFIGGDPSRVRNECNLSHRANVSEKISIPDSIGQMLKAKYIDMLHNMSKDIGGYCIKWYEEVNGSTSYHDNSIVSYPATIQV